MAFGDNFLKQAVDSINNVNVSEFTQKGKDIAKNLQGFLDTGANTLGKTLDSATNLLAGKAKRMKSQLSKFTDAKIDLKAGPVQVTWNVGDKQQGPEDLD